MAKPPTIVSDGHQLSVRESKEYEFDCPKCKKPIRITAIAPGTLIRCTDCDNVTWRPDFVPKWWTKTSRFIASITLSFTFGIVTSLAASVIFEKYAKSWGFSSQQNPPSITSK